MTRYFCVCRSSTAAVSVVVRRLRAERATFAACLVRYTTPLKDTLTKMLSGTLSFDAFPSLLPMPQEVRYTAAWSMSVSLCCGHPSLDLGSAGGIGRLFEMNSGFSLLRGLHFVAWGGTTFVPLCPCPP